MFDKLLYKLDNKPKYCEVCGKQLIREEVAISNSQLIWVKISCPDWYKTSLHSNHTDYHWMDKDR